MRALLIATGYNENLLPIVQYRPTPAFKILDRPILVHIIEFLVEQKINKVDLILSHLPHMIEDLLEEGKRWGIQVTYHLCKEASRPYGALSLMAEEWEDETILLGQGDRLPKFEFPWVLEVYQQKNRPVFLMSGGKKWSGWALLSAKDLSSLPSDLSSTALFRHFEEEKPLTLKTSPFLSVDSLQEFRKSNLDFLKKEQHSLFPVTAHLIRPGIWISRAASVHPTAKLHPPLLIGEYTQIKEHAVIGPYAIIENNCYVDESSTIDHSIICQHTYVGQRLEVKNCIVDRNHLINLALQTHVLIREEFILGKIKSPKWPLITEFFIERIVASLLLLLFSPLMVLLLLKKPLDQREVLALPARQESDLWHSFTLFSFANDPFQLPKGWIEWLPGLWNIVRGDLHFVGTPPRSKEETLLLPTEWRRLYIRSKAGMIQLADIDYGKNPSKDDLFACESYYSARMSFAYDCIIAFKFLIKKMLKIFLKG